MLKILEIALWDRYLKLVWVLLAHLSLEYKLRKILNEILIVFTLVN